MGAGPVAFNYSAWQQQYPTFVNVSEPFANDCFTAAGQFCDNTAQSPVCDATQLTYFLNLLTCHICWLICPQVNGMPNDSGAGSLSPIVGRINSATEGTVSVQSELQVPGGAAWYAQTQWGLLYWTASGAYRMARYMPGPPSLSPGARLFGGPWGYGRAGPWSGRGW